MAKCTVEIPTRKHSEEDTIPFLPAFDATTPSAGGGAAWSHHHAPGVFCCRKAVRHSSQLRIGLAPLLRTPHRTEPRPRLSLLMALPWRGGWSKNPDNGLPASKERTGIQTQTHKHANDGLIRSVPTVWVHEGLGRCDGCIREDNGLSGACQTGDGGRPARRCPTKTGWGARLRQTVLATVPRSGWSAVKL
jgi:hypothetical protein